MFDLRRPAARPQRPFQAQFSGHRILPAIITEGAAAGHAATQSLEFIGRVRLNVAWDEITAIRRTGQDPGNRNMSHFLLPASGQCRAQEVIKYLRGLLTRIAAHSINRLAELLPDQWSQEPTPVNP